MLYFLGGSGGIIFWVDRWLNRRHLKIRRFVEDIGVGNGIVEILFEAENLGSQATSLKPTITYQGLTIRRRLKKNFEFEITSPRSLSPHTPLTITARLTSSIYNPNSDDNIGFHWFKRYKIFPTKGRARLIRLRHVGQNSKIGFLRFHIEGTIFKWFGKLFSD